MYLVNVKFSVGKDSVFWIVVSLDESSPSPPLGPPWFPPVFSPLLVSVPIPGLFSVFPPVLDPLSPVPGLFGLLISSLDG